MPKATFFFRLEDLEALAGKIVSACEVHGPVVEELERRVRDLEEASTAMDSSQASKVAGDLTREIQVCT